MNESHSPSPSIVRGLKAAFDLIAGRVKADDGFDFSVRGFWEAVIGAWIFGVLMSLPLLNFGVKFLVVSAGTSLISLLFYALFVWHVLVWIDRSDKFIRFLVPFYWLNALQLVLIGLISGVAWMTNIYIVQLAVLPIAVWIFVWQFRIARDQIGIRTFSAICFVVARLIIHLALNWIFLLQNNMIGS